MTALISGSMAFDTVMQFDDKFKNHILPDQIDILNISFLAPEMARNYGGCAGNISFNLNLLGGSSLPVATVGSDFSPYMEWMSQNKIINDGIKQIESAFTAQAFITTDVDNNQITTFHPGAMNFSHLNKIGVYEGVSLGIVSPNGRQGMIDHSQQFNELGIPFIFDPGQGMPMFTGDELNKFVEQASWLAFNDYEAKLMEEKTGISINNHAKKVEAIIVTHGEHGSTIFTNGTSISIPSAPIKKAADPTGCGDAYRAGLIFGLMNNLDWEITGRIASLMGAIKIEKKGSQNHFFSRNDFKDRFKDAFQINFS